MALDYHLARLTPDSDGIGVGVMLELARVMIERNDAINGSVIFGMSLTPAAGFAKAR